MLKHAVLLIVDDDKYVLSALGRLFRINGYEIALASNGYEAMDVIRTRPVGVIITDYLMPEMTGFEVLKKTRNEYPDTVRIMLSGCSGIINIPPMIEQGLIYQYIEKPWHDEQLVSCVEEAFITFKETNITQIKTALKTNNNSSQLQQSETVLLHKSNIVNSYI